MELTAERIREVLRYDPETGAFTWIKSTGTRMKPGQPAGSLSKTNGYITLGLDGKRLRAHRIAWLYVYGRSPAGHIDHINGDTADNRLCNLREATRTQNLANSKRYKNNKSGLKGVHWHPQSGKWRVQVRLNRRNNHVGLFADKHEAHRAYLDAASRLFGEFATSGERSAPSIVK